MTSVLVVDDEPIVRSVGVRYLRRDGFETLEAADGIAARDLIERAAPELVLLDVMVPGLDGLRYADWLLDLSEFPVVLGARPVRSHLVHALVSLDREFTSVGRDERWEDWYAARLSAEFGA